MIQSMKRHPTVPHSRLALGVVDREFQIRRGLYVTERGERFAIPVDRLDEPTKYAGRTLWRRDPVHGTYRPGVQFSAPGTDLHKRLLAWLRDHVNEGIPHAYYMAVLGHDVHASIRGDLFARHFHVGWANPLDPGRFDSPLDPLFQTNPDRARLAKLAPSMFGFVENCGWVSGGKVTDAFVSEMIAELVSTAGTEFADFDFHEVGTSTQAESNNDTALIATSGIARATGTPTDSDPIYQNVGTITADATETWEEHGLFNNISGAALMDRSLTSGQAVVSSDQVEYTYQLTVNPEA